MVKIDQSCLMIHEFSSLKREERKYVLAEMLGEGTGKIKASI